MKSSKKIIVALIILILLGILAIFFVGYRDIKPSVTPERAHPRSDSSTHSPADRIPDEMGAKPLKKPDGSLPIIEAFVKTHAKNPESFKFLEWSDISSEGRYWKVRCKYKGVSSFDAEVTTNAWFYIQNNKVVYTKIISKI